MCPNADSVDPRRTDPPCAESTTNPRAAKPPSLGGSTPMHLSCRRIWTGNIAEHLPDPVETMSDEGHNLLCVRPHRNIKVLKKPFKRRTLRSHSRGTFLSLRTHLLADAPWQTSHSGWRDRSGQQYLALKDVLVHGALNPIASLLHSILADFFH